MGALKISSGSIEKGQWGALKKSGGYCVGSMGALVRVNGGMEKGSTVALKRVNERVPKGQVTPYVVWVAYAGGLRIAYAITVLAYAGDMPLDAYAEALRGLTPTWVLLTPTSIWQGSYTVWWLGFWNVLQWGHWSGPMQVLKRVSGGVGQGQWGYWKGAMGALVRVNAGIEQQWGLNGGIEKDQWGHWSGSIGVLKRGEWGRWSGSMRPLGRVRSERGLGCKLYLAGF